jgi:hypothetical protein
VKPPFYLFWTRSSELPGRSSDLPGRSSDLLGPRASRPQCFVRRRAFWNHSIRASRLFAGGTPAVPAVHLSGFELVSPLESLLDKALSRSLNYAIRNQAGLFTYKFSANYIRGSVIETKSFRRRLK